MIRHIVMWQFKENTEKEMNEFLEKLYNLKEEIDLIKHIEVRKNNNPDNDYDAILISDFKSLEDLHNYKVDPRHQAVSSLCKSIRISRASVDYEI